MSGEASGIKCLWFDEELSQVTAAVLRAQISWVWVTVDSSVSLQIKTEFSPVLILIQAVLALEEKAWIVSTPISASF